MIPIGSLKDDYYMLDEDNYQVIGRRYGRTYKLGYPVHIRVRHVDLLKKQIDFDLVDEDDRVLMERNHSTHVPSSSNGKSQRGKKGSQRSPKNKKKGHSK